MATNYSQLVQKPVNGNMTVFNTQTGQGYSTPEQLAGDLGVDKSVIQWGNIQTNPNWSFQGTTQNVTQTPSTPVSGQTTTPTQAPTPSPLSVVSSMVGTRASSVDPKVTEYFNTQTGKGFTSPEELAKFVSGQGVQATSQNVFDQLKQGFNQLKNTQAPPTQGEAQTLMGEVVPPAPPDLSNIETALANDPGYQQLLKDYAEYNNIANQSTSLLDTYQQMVKSTGLEGINTELLNTKKVIEGTEDDIRNEVTAANGFATESQVQALAISRNKSLVKNYNALVDQANSIQSQVNMMVGLSAQDRENALNMARTKLEIDQQINNYRDKFISNAREGYVNYINAVGYDGLYQALQNDPTRLSLVERTLGLPSGTIASAAIKEREVAQMESSLKQAQLDAAQFELANAQEMAPLEKKLKQAQIANIYSDIGNRGAGNTTQTIEKVGNKDYIVTKQNGQIVGMTEFTGQQMNAADEAVKQIMSTSASWGEAADKINKAFGSDQAATSYDKQLSAYFGQGQDLNKVFEMLSPEQTKNMAQIQSNIQQITELTSNKALNSAVGPTYLARFSVANQLSGAKSNFIAGVEQLRSQLNLDALIQAKSKGATFGALSDQELKVLSNSASKIGSWAIVKNGQVTGYSANEKDFRAELDKINNFAKLDYILKGGNPSEVGVQKMPDGAYWTQNSDGTMTKIR